MKIKFLIIIICMFTAIATGLAQEVDKCIEEAEIFSLLTPDCYHEVKDRFDREDIHLIKCEGRIPMFTQHFACSNGELLNQTVGMQNKSFAMKMMRSIRNGDPVQNDCSFIQNNPSLFTSWRYIKLTQACLKQIADSELQEKEIEEQVVDAHKVKGIVE
ncbi:MAG: hypothetical protein HOE90_03945 [Bacteriovoracaceae bacterium]|jgi:hypothetical protein|nr:hypothetical protein [Bacteriovoracaceae bacterium]